MMKELYIMIKLYRLYPNLHLILEIKVEKNLYSLGLKKAIEMFN